MIEVWLGWSLVSLALIANAQTFFQVGAGPGIWLLGLLPLAYGFTRKSKNAWPPLSPTFLILAIGLLAWVSVSGYYPVRDHDAYAFWMPKAKALASFGFIPQAPSEDPRYLMHQTYPLGLVSLSAAVHSFCSQFYPWLHRFLSAFQSIVLWAALYRVWGTQRLFLRDAVLVALVAVQPSVWGNGYHDAQWALAFAVGCAWVLVRGNVAAALPWLILGSLGKAEGQTLAPLVVLALFAYSRRPLVLLAAVPAILWSLTTKYLGFEGVRAFVWPMHSFLDVSAALWAELKPLLLFKTVFGGTSAALVLALLFLPRLRLRYAWLPALSVASYLAAYFLSVFDPAWHVHFSFVRIMLFPLYAVVIFSALDPRPRLTH